MATNILETLGTQIVLLDTASFTNTESESLVRAGATTGLMPLESTIADAAAVESATVDLGSTFATRFRVGAALEFSSAPTAGEAVYLYGGFAPTTGAFGGGLTAGASGAYAGTSASTVGESVKQLDLIGVFVCTDDGPGTVQIANNCGEFTAGNRYMKVVLRNEAGQSIAPSGGNHIVIDPIITQSQ